MGLSVPAGVDINPMPVEFSPNIEDSAKTYAWRGAVNVETATSREQMQLEFGYRKTGNASQDAALLKTLRSEIWIAQELARLGRTDLLANYSADRHKAPRTVSQPEIPPAA